MVLSDGLIKRRLGRPGRMGLTIEPLVEDNIEPASVDLRLGDSFIKYAASPNARPVDTRNLETFEGRGEKFTADEVTIEPGEFYLGTTMESFELPPDLAASVKGRSSIGRLGVVVHKTAGFVDPGYEGEITLEITVDAPHPVKLYKGQRICQIVFHPLSVGKTLPAERPYGHEKSQYQGQSGATESGMEFE